MALPSTAYRYTLDVSLVDDGVYQSSLALTAARHPSETLEHLQLRVLSYCLFWREGVALGAGLDDGDASDVWARDLVGEVTLWVECGAATPDKLLKAASAHPLARLALVTASPRRESEFLAAARKLDTRRLDAVELWALPPDLLAALGRHDDRRSTWSVTLTDGHLYLTVDRETLDAPLAVRTVADALRG